MASESLSFRSEERLDNKNSHWHENGTVTLKPSIYFPSAPAQHERSKTVEMNEAYGRSSWDWLWIPVLFWAISSGHPITSFKPGTEALFTVSVQCLSNTMEKEKKNHNGEGGRRALTAWKEQSHQLNFNIIWNVLELAETMAGLMTLGVCHLLLESDFPGKRASSLGMSHASQASQPRRGRLDEEDWWGCAWTWRRPRPECQTRRAVELLMPCPYVCLHRADNEITLLCLWGKASNIYSILNCSSYISLRLSNSVDPSAEDCWFR